MATGMYCRLEDSDDWHQSVSKLTAFPHEKHLLGQLSVHMINASVYLLDAIDQFDETAENGSNLRICVIYVELETNLVESSYFNWHISHIAMVNILCVPTK